jgi:hypothetical protein
MTIHPVGAELLMRADGHADTTKPAVAFFCNFAKAPNKNSDGCTRRKAYRGKRGKIPIILSIGTRRKWLISFWFRPLTSDTINLVRTEWEKTQNTVRTLYCLLHTSTNDGIQRDMNGWTCSIHFSFRDKGHMIYIINCSWVAARWQ